MISRDRKHARNVGFVFSSQINDLNEVLSLICGGFLFLLFFFSLAIAHIPINTTFMIMCHYPSKSLGTNKRYTYHYESVPRALFPKQITHTASEKKSIAILKSFLDISIGKYSLNNVKRSNANITTFISVGKYLRKYQLSHIL